jgi:hypothetical protein
MDDFHGLFLIAAEEDRISWGVSHALFMVIGHKVAKARASPVELLPEESCAGLGGDDSIFPESWLKTGSPVICRTESLQY